MGNNKKTNVTQSKSKSQNKITYIQGKNGSIIQKFMLLIVAVLVIVIFGFSFLNNGKGTDTSSASTDKLKIIKSEVTSKVKFYPYEVGGIKMELMAIKADDGTIRTAFNTCQVCYSSGKGYYKQDGKEVVCQNCGNRFDINAIGDARNGCNPIPIPDEYKSDDGSNILIDKAYLDQSKSFFENWKTL